jgi:myo-inositol 2-dehydrogenase/D-chiro-inositol 1-dehydrogenase
MFSDELRFGLIGYGLWGAHHARSIDKTQGARLTAVAVPSPESRSAVKTDHAEADVHADYRQLLDRDDIDAVSVVVPNWLHYEVARAALDAGKHVLLEKPMALHVAHCDKLIAAAQANGRVLAINHEMRLSILWGKVKQLIDSGAIGVPQYALVELSRFPYRRGSTGWRYDVARVGNWILEEPIHFFDLSRWYLSRHGEPVSVYARANSRQPDRAELQDNFSAVVNFASGAYAVVTQTLAAFEHHVTCKVTGTDGAIWARWSAPDARSPEPVFSLRYSSGEELHEVPFGQITGEVVELEQQIEAMVRSAKQGTPPPVTGSDGRWSVLLCLAAQQSADNGQLVQIDRFVDASRRRIGNTSRDLS